MPTVKLTPPGVYRFTTTWQTPPSPTTVTYIVTEDTIKTTFGELEFHMDPDGGHYQVGAISLATSPDGTFVAINGGQSFGGTWHRVS